MIIIEQGIDDYPYTTQLFIGEVPETFNLLLVSMNSEKEGNVLHHNVLVQRMPNIVH